jgi:rhamnosyltransferase
VTTPVGRSVGFLVPTRNGERGLSRCLGPLLATGLGPVLVIDSSSTDGTADAARRLGAEVAVIAPGDFDHGATREWGRRRLGTDVVVMVTQDAFAVSSRDVARLAAPVADGTAAAAYGRQLARPGSGLLERFPREFSYGSEPEYRSAADIRRLGVRAFLCSNAFAAWDNHALDDVGGFPTTPTHEDAIAAARLLRAGYGLAYVADACVEHSHRLTPVEEFRRFFDAGHARSRFARDLRARGGHSAEGLRYVRGLLGHPDRRAGDLLPALAQIAARLMGYRLGTLGDRLPWSVVSRLGGRPCASPSRRSAISVTSSGRG